MLIIYPLSVSSLTTVVTTSLFLNTPYEMQPGLARLSYITLPPVHLILQSAQSLLNVFHTAQRNGLLSLLDQRNGTLHLTLWPSNATTFSCTMPLQDPAITSLILSAMIMPVWEL